jgi:hypothetical protein
MPSGKNGPLIRSRANCANIHRLYEATNQSVYSPLLMVSKKYSAPHEIPGWTRSHQNPLKALV